MPEHGSLKKGQLLYPQFLQFGGQKTLKAEAYKIDIGVRIKLGGVLKRMKLGLKCRNI